MSEVGRLRGCGISWVYPLIFSLALRLSTVRNKGTRIFRVNTVLKTTLYIFLIVFSLVSDVVIIVATLLVIIVGSTTQIFAASTLRGLRFFQILRMVRIDRKAGSWKLLASVVWAHRRVSSPFEKRWHYYENTPIWIYWKFHHQKNWKFSDKNSDIFHISVQNIDCGYSLEPPRWGGFNEYRQSMFLVEIRKIMYTPCKPQFYYITLGFKGVKII